MVSEGEEARDFTLQADDGREVSLSDYRGKKVVLYFYPKDGTPGCTREAVEFRDMAKEFEKEDAVILGVSKDSVKSHQKFKLKHGLPFTCMHARVFWFCRRYCNITSCRTMLFCMLSPSRARQRWKKLLRVVVFQVAAKDIVHNLA